DCVGLLVRSRLQGRRVPGSKPDSTQAQPSVGPLYPKSGAVRHTSSHRYDAGNASSGIDLFRRVRDPIQNIPCIASKRDGDI
ncbi:hypothetical protein AVEN_150723-1, partial [Araneus ventricosus]